MGDLPTLRVSELFYSLQGEGARAGEPSVFVRLQGCSAKHACYEAGVRCDTEFESGQTMTVDEIAAWATQHAPECRWIIWTGGEPLDQLHEGHLDAFPAFSHALETSGARPLPVALADRLAWVVVSPKVAEHVLVKHFPSRVRGGTHVHELRYVRHQWQAIPTPSLTAQVYYLSPHAAGQQLDPAAVQYCVGLCLRHPRWRLNLPQHKRLGIL